MGVNEHIEGNIEERYLVETWDHRSHRMVGTGQLECVGRRSWARIEGTGHRNRSPGEDRRWVEHRYEDLRWLRDRIACHDPT